MRGRTNTSGIEENSGYKLLPEGDYHFEIDEIAEKTTSNQDPMAMITLKVIEGIFKNCNVWDNIVIPAPNSPAIKIMGRTKFFWHCIGEPYEGDVSWDTSRWLHKRVWATVKHEVQKEGKYAGKSKAVIANYILNEPAFAEQTNSDSPDL